MRLLFMGTSDFAAEILDTLIQDKRFDVAAVYAKAYRDDKPGAVAKLAKVFDIDAIRTPISLKAPEEINFLRDLHFDAGVVADYGVLLPKEILQLPRYGFLNAHPSLLPRWRGAAPIERALMAGDKQTGMCVMEMSEALDEGAIFSCERIDINANETAGELRRRLAPIATKALIHVLEDLREGRTRTTPQSAEGVCYAKKISKLEGRIDWRLPAEEIDRRIRACTPAPGAWFEVKDGKRGGLIRIGVLCARPVAQASNDALPGTVLNDTPHIACGSGALELMELQREGRTPMTASAFLRGFPLPIGEQLLPCRVTD